jgi:flagellar hook protein FlgE
MIGSFQTGVSGLQQFQQDLEVIGNNIANVDTVGFKSSRVDFADALSQNLNSGGVPMQVGTGVVTAAIKGLFNQGMINNTGVATDLAVSGRGYFVVRDPSSGATFASRDGAFTVDVNGYLVNNAGMRVQGYVGTAPFTPGSTIGDIQINAAAAIASLGDTNPTPPTLAGFNFDSAGQVNARLSDGVSGVIAQVTLQDFINPQELIRESNNLFSWSALAGPMASPIAPMTGGLGKVDSGALEQSNVDLSNEMTSLITAQRAFQANAKIVTTSDEMLQDLINLKR